MYLSIGSTVAAPSIGFSESIDRQLTGLARRAGQRGSAGAVTEPSLLGQGHGEPPNTRLVHRHMYLYTHRYPAGHHPRCPSREPLGSRPALRGWCWLRRRTRCPALSSHQQLWLCGAVPTVGCSCLLCFCARPQRPFFWLQECQVNSGKGLVVTEGRDVLSSEKQTTTRQLEPAQILCLARCSTAV